MHIRSALSLLGVLLLLESAIVAGAMLFGLPFVGLFVAVMALLFSVFMATTFYSVFRGAPWVPTGKDNVEEMMRMADVRQGDRVADLGSGDGRVLVAAAKRGAVAEGWEISPFMWLFSWWNIRKHGVQDRAHTHLASFWPPDMSRFDVITLFLLDTQMKKMEAKLRRELRPGSRVVSYAFTFPTWKHAESNGNGMRVYRI